MCICEYYLYVHGIIWRCRKSNLCGSSGYAGGRIRRYVPDRSGAGNLPEDLSVSFDGMEVVKHVNIEVNSGEIVGIVGESGSGKSITSLTLMGLLSKQAQVTSGKIIVDGEVLREADRPFDERLYRRFQGSRMSMIFQEPMTSLNPVFRIGEQVDEIVALHNPTMSKEEVKRVRLRCSSWLVSQTAMASIGCIRTSSPEVCVSVSVLRSVWRAIRV